MKLYEIAERFRNLQEVAEYENIDKKLIDEAMGSVQEEFEEKANNIAKIIRSLEAGEKALKEEAKRLTDRAKMINNNMIRLKRYIEDGMIAIDKKKFKTTFFSFGIQKNVPSLDIQNEANITDDYYVIEKKIDRKKLLEDIKAGLVVDGVTVKQSESLRIR